MEVPMVYFGFLSGAFLGGLVVLVVMSLLFLSGNSAGDFLGLDSTGNFEVKPQTTVEEDRDYAESTLTQAW
jgi:hypothetical protein